MKLTKEFKTRLANMVVKDVQQVDYRKKLEDYLNKVHHFQKRQWLIDLEENYPEAIPSLNDKYLNVYGMSGISFKVFTPVLSEKDEKVVDEYASLNRENARKKSEIYIKLMSAFALINTLNQLKSNFPYLMNYIDSLTNSVNTKLSAKSVETNNSIKNISNEIKNLLDKETLRLIKK